MEAQDGDHELTFVSLSGPAEALHRALEVGARWRPLEMVAGGGHDVLEEPQVLRALEVFWKRNGLSPTARPIHREVT